MSHATTQDGVKLYYEEAGSGKPLIFVHEYAGDHRSWEPQMRFFSRYYRCIAFNARGYPPSDVPQDPEKYSQARARDDIRSVLDHLGIDRAACLRPVHGRLRHAAFRHRLRQSGRFPSSSAAAATAPSRRSASSSARRPTPPPSRSRSKACPRSRSATRSARRACSSRTRIPRGWREFADQLAEHSTLGSALTMRGVQARRPSLWELADAMKTHRACPR